MRSLIVRTSLAMAICRYKVLVRRGRSSTKSKTTFLRAATSSLYRHCSKTTVADLSIAIKTGNKREVFEFSEVNVYYSQEKVKNKLYF